MTGRIETPRSETVTFAIGSDTALAADTDTTPGEVVRDPAASAFDVTVMDDEYLLTFAADRVRVPEGADSIKLTLNLSRVLGRDVLMRLSYYDDISLAPRGLEAPATLGSPGQTTSGEDYTPVHAFPEVTTIGAGDSSLTLTIPLIDDTLTEGVERVRIIVTPEHTPYGFPADSDLADVYIVDNDPDGDGVTVVPASLRLTEAGTAGTYTVQLDSDPVEDVMVTVEVPAAHQDAVTVQGPTSAAGTSATLSFTTSNWNTPQTVTVQAIQDTDSVGESVSLAMTASVADNGNPYHRIAIDPVMVQVTDNNSNANLTFSETDDETTVSEDGTTVTDTYTVVLNTEPTHEVTVTSTSGDTAAATVNPGTLTFSTSNWGTAQTVTVTGVDDSTDNPGGGREVSISHVSSSTDSNYGIANGGTVVARVTDDDATTVTLSGAAGNIREVRRRSSPLSWGVAWWRGRA